MKNCTLHSLRFLSHHSLGFPVFPPLECYLCFDLSSRLLRAFFFFFLSSYPSFEYNWRLGDGVHGVKTEFWFLTQGWDQRTWNIKWGFWSSHFPRAPFARWVLAFLCLLMEWACWCVCLWGKFIINSISSLNILDPFKGWDNDLLLCSFNEIIV